MPGLWSQVAAVGFPCPKPWVPLAVGDSELPGAEVQGSHELNLDDMCLEPRQLVPGPECFPHCVPSSVGNYRRAREGCEK
jgi:hypothetical protein